MTGWPHAVSLGTPFELASIWLPRFQPAPMSVTICAALSCTSADAGVVRPDPATASAAARRATLIFRAFETMGVSPGNWKALSKTVGRCSAGRQHFTGNFDHGAAEIANTFDESTVET